MTQQDTQPPAETLAIESAREAVARIVDPKAWEDHDYWASRLRGDGHWPDEPEKIAMMRRSYERRMPLRVAESFRRADTILAALSPQPKVENPMTNEDRADLLADEYLGNHYDFLDNIERDRWHAYRAGALAALTRRAGGDAIPAGMKPWHGGDEAPADWDGGGVVLRNGSTMFPSKVSFTYHANGTNRWNHDRPHRNPDWDIVAYTPKPPAGGDAIPNSWARSAEDTRAMALLLAEVELHLKSSRIFITTREKMHPCGVNLHDELAVKVTAALDNLGREDGDA